MNKKSSIYAYQSSLIYFSLMKRQNSWKRELLNMSGGKNLRNAKDSKGWVEKENQKYTYVRKKKSKKSVNPKSEGISSEKIEGG